MTSLTSRRANAKSNHILILLKQYFYLFLFFSSQQAEDTPLSKRRLDADETYVFFFISSANFHLLETFYVRPRIL